MFMKIKKQPVTKAQIKQRKLELFEQRTKIIVAIDLLKSWSLTLSGAAALAPLFRDGKMPLMGGVVIAVSLVLHVHMVVFAKFVR